VNWARPSHSGLCTASLRWHQCATPVDLQARSRRRSSTTVSARGLHRPRKHRSNGPMGHPFLEPERGMRTNFPSENQVLEFVTITAVLENDFGRRCNRFDLGSDCRSSRIGQRSAARRVSGRQSSGSNDFREKRGTRPWKPNKIQDRFLTHQPRNDERT
jgi:hypothetical protein